MRTPPPVDRAGLHVIPISSASPVDVRAPAHAGTSCPRDAAALRVHLEGFFDTSPTTPPCAARLSGLVAPHIDLRVGGHAFGEAYAALAAGDSIGFFRVLATDRDRTRICGAAPLLVFLALMRGVRDRLLRYDQHRDDATSSLVTYASLAFPAP